MTVTLTDPGTSPVRRELSLPLVVTSLMRGVVYREADPEVWRQLLALRSDVRYHVSTLGLVAVVDESEGHAFLRQRPDDELDGLPRLVARHTLSFPVSLLLALLRQRLARFDAGPTGSRLVLTGADVAQLVTAFLPDRSGHARVLDTLDASLARIVELGFLRRMPDGGYEVRRVLKAFVDAQWLAGFDARLAEYAAQLAPAGEDPA